MWHLLPPLKSGRNRLPQKRLSTRKLTEVLRLHRLSLAPREICGDREVERSPLGLSAALSSAEGWELPYGRLLSGHPQNFRKQYIQVRPEVHLLPNWKNFRLSKLGMEMRVGQVSGGSIEMQQRFLYGLACSATVRGLGEIPCAKSWWDMVKQTACEHDHCIETPVAVASVDLFAQADEFAEIERC